jgi:acetate---CoA ligase (ADP-forming)
VLSGRAVASQGKAKPSVIEQLRPLFFPRSIAVVGVSQELWKPGSAMLKALQSFGFSGLLYVVGRGGGQVLGLDVYESVAALPEPVDLAFLFVPAKALPAAVRDCREKGVRCVVAFAAGFGETGTEAGRALDAELAGQCDGSFRMIGPNCLGVYCPAGGITQHCGREYPSESGGVAFIAQSGGLTEDFIHAMRNRGFFASKVVSYGNACDLNETDLLEYMSLDPSTRAIGMYVEGPRDGRRLFELLRQTASHKPVVMWRGGLTPEGAQAAGSHTGSLAGSLEVWEAMLEQVGATRVTSLEDMLDTLAAFHFLEDRDDLRVGYVCSGGGFGVAATDASCRSGLSLPMLSPETRAKIEAFLLPAGTSSANPVDVFVPFPSSGSLKGVLEAVAGSGEVGTIIIDRIAMSTELRRLMNMSELLEKEDDPWLYQLPVQIRGEYGIPVIVVLREDGDPLGRAAFEGERLRLRHYYQQNGVVVYPTAERAFRALGHVVGHNRRRATQLGEPEPTVATASARDRAQALIQNALERGQKNLSEHESKQVLAAYGIPVTREKVVASLEELTAALSAFAFPLVLKIDSPDVLHKTEAGLVEVGCESAQDARAAFMRIMMKARQEFPAALVNGVLVQEMVEGAAECIVGMKVDRQFGPAIIFGLGGTMVEVFKDVALRVAPLARADAAAMVRGIRGYKILAGVRGQAMADVPAIEDIVVRMSALALDVEPYISEIDVNPLMALSEGHGAVAVDALMVLRNP